MFVAIVYILNIHCLHAMSHGIDLVVIAGTFQARKGVPGLSVKGKHSPTSAT